MATYKARIVPSFELRRAAWSRNPAVIWPARVVLPPEATPIGLSPEILSVAALSSTSIRITFKYAATDNAALRAPGNYPIVPTLVVYSVTPEAVASPTYADLVIDEQEDGQLYSVSLQRIVRAAV